MRICLFVKEYDHPKLGKSGGTGVFYRQLAEALVKKGHEVTVLGSARKGLKLKKGSLEINLLPNYFKKYKIAEIARSLSQRMGFHNILKTLFLKEIQYLKKHFLSQDQHFDLIETHDWDAPLLALESIEYPVVVRYHGSWTVLSEAFNYKRVSKVKKSLERRAAKISKYNICVSNHGKELAIRHLCQELHHPYIIPNGANFGNERSDKKITDKIVFVGHLSPEKGLDTALEAFKIYSKNRPKATLYLIGSTTKDSKKILSGKLCERIKILGRLEHSEVLHHLASAEMALLPSQGENFGLTVVEALANATPVISRPLDTNLELNSPLLVTANTPKEFALRMQDARHSFNLEIAQSEAKRIRTMYSFDKMLKETLTLYSSL